MKQQFKQHICRASLVMLTSLALLPTAQAANTMAPVVVTAQRMATNPGNASADVTVISRQEIEASQASNVAELLRSQAGLDVASSGGPGGNTSVFIRGGNSGHTLVLLDGMRVGSATVGSFDWGNFSTSDIERIEIVRGPQSSLYGADAMGGVIQIFTRKGQLGMQSTASFESGTYGTKKTNIAVRSGDAKGATYGVSFEDYRTDGFSAASNGTEADANKRITLGAQMDFSSGKIDTAINLRRSDATTGVDGYDAVTFTFGDIQNYELNNTQTTAAIKFTDHMSDRYDSSIQFSRVIDDVVATDPVNLRNNSDFKTTKDQITWLNQYDTADGSMVLGYDTHTSKGDSNSAGLHETMTQHGVFMSMLSDGSSAQWNASVRYDKNSASSNETTYKLGMVWHLADAMRFTANYGTGFKAPSLNDLYFPDDGFGTKGNPNLKAETSKSWDVGLEYKSDAALLSVVWFKQRYDQLIAWEMDPVTFGFSPNNVNKATTKGLEWQTAYRGSWGFVRGNYTTLSATDDDTGNWLARRAEKSGNVVLGTDFGGFHLETEMNMVGKRFNDNANVTALDAYKTYHLRLAYAMTDSWKLHGRIDNFKDVVYEEVSGYATAGRTSYVGVSAIF